MRAAGEAVLATLRTAFAAAVLTGLLAVMLTACSSADPEARVIAGSGAPEGWKTIAYRGVEVDIPSSWGPVDMSDCEFSFEHWAAPDSPECESDPGVAFYGSATFDPVSGPGVRRTTANGEPTWGGYVTSGDVAVYTSHPDRAVAEAVLASVHTLHEQGGDPDPGTSG